MDVVGFCGAKVFARFHGLLWGFGGLWGVFVGFREVSRAFVGFRGVSWVSWAFLGFCFYTRFRVDVVFEGFFSTWRLAKTAVISSIFQIQFLP